MKDFYNKRSYLTEGGYIGYFTLNKRRTEIHNPFNEIFKLYTLNPLFERDFSATIKNLTYSEYHSPNNETFKKLKK